MNKNIWNLYKNSETGKEAISLFTFTVTDFVDTKATEIFKKYNEYFGGLDVEDYFVENCILFTNSIIVDELFGLEDESVTEYFERLIDNLEINLVEENPEGKLVRKENELPIILKNDYRTYCAILSEISLVLYFNSPTEFYPMLFREQFDVFMKILDVLKIPMPDLPSKSDKRGRLMFYDAINKNISKFANENELTPEETCACIYDFAFIMLEENDISKEIPEPTNIWLTGGSKGDYKSFLENPIEGSKSVWTCNENTKRGDIIIMYVLSPYSCLQSIWRADIDGIYTPFNYYNSRTRAVDGVLIPKITLNELKADPYFSQLGITRKNFQGVNGIQFSANDYKELQRLLKEKGFDISLLPQLYRPNLEIEGNLKNEKDVEEKLLIPLLEKLGYSQLDWSRQLSQKAGRNEKAIPDFVFLPKGDKHFQNAPMIIEAKYNMSSNIERTKSYNQALSYARMMKSRLLGICDKDRLIIYKEKNSIFDRFVPTFEKYWQNINDAETFRELKLLIGKEALK
ncbi:MAG: restriction endonuclease subunit R [Sphingobacteriales bacterium]|nr:MAG: restriction endonuclease subunit R [Sphingobacteriales bacterium]